MLKREHFTTVEQDLIVYVGVDDYPSPQSLLSLGDLDSGFATTVVNRNCASFVAG